MRPITSSDDLLALLEDINSKIMSRPQESWALVSNARALSKARCASKFGDSYSRFYLGFLLTVAQNAGSKAFF
jgi:hypothetical protein